MKKLLSLLFVMIIALSVVGCNSILPNGNSGNNASTDEFDTNKVTLASAYGKAQSLGFEGTLEEFVELISGKDGVDGNDGIDGKDGVGITSVLIDNNGDLLVILSDGNTVNCGKVKGSDGKDGVDGADGKTPYIEDGYWYIDGMNTGVKAEGTNGITPTIEVNDEGFWVINGVKTEHKAIGVDGTNGKDGIDGINGTNGADGKTPTFKVENGELKVSYDNGLTWSSLGYIQGKDGENGTNGTDGTNGIDGKTPYIQDGYWYIDGTNTGVKAEGVDGTNGVNGVGIKEITVNEDGKLVITLTDGTVLDPIEIPTGAGHKHDFGEWIDYRGNANVSCENRLFYHICKECKALEWQSGSYESHDFDTVTTEPTCVSEGYDTNTCSVCGFIEITNQKGTVDHEYEAEYSYNNSFHWYDCKNCETTTAYGEHTTDDSGYCTVCDNPAGATVGILYDLSADGTYAMVIGYSGNATRIVIADTYNGVPVTSIYREAFYQNSNITSVVIPDSVTTIGDSAFRGCTGFTDIKIGKCVTSIGNYTFADCSNLTTITIPNSLTSIGEGAFVYCKKVTSVNISDLLAWCNISFANAGSSPLYSGNTKINLYLSGNLIIDLVIPVGVNSIPSYAFYRQSSITSLTISDSVTTVGASAFENCSSLSSIVNHGIITSIGLSAFENCNSSLYTEYEYGKYVCLGDNPHALLVKLSNKNFESYTINEDTKLIGPAVFLGCNRLTTITIPDSVISIGDQAFQGCISLTSATITDSITSIGKRAFYGCKNLTNIKYKGTETKWQAISKGDEWNVYHRDVATTVKIPYTLTYNYTED